MVYSPEYDFTRTVLHHKSLPNMSLIRGILFAIPEHSFASTLRAVAKLQFARTRVITLHAHSVVAHAHQLYVRLKARQRDIMAYNHELIASATSY